MRPPRALLVLGFLAFVAAGPDKPTIPAAKTEITAESREQIVGDIVRAAKEKWLTQGLAADQAERLSSDITILIRAYLADDFDSVNHLWTERGAKLGDWAGAIADAELDSGRYDEVDVARLSSATAEDRLRYVWTHPAARNAQWQRIGPARAGTTLSVRAGSAEWPVNGASSMSSRWFAPADQEALAAWKNSESGKPAPTASGWQHLQAADADAKPASHWVSLQNKAMDGQAPAAFVQFPVKFRGGGTVLLRMSFAYDEARAAWYPLELMYSDGSLTLPLF
jgi:hypothetical protein